ncbi:ribonuclease HII [Alicyclobacillus tolerans]|uniref:ribonuclease HII n=1 Tax=Alicyclobacillus tolerans TaxID=90970 RepID=UPI001F01B24D|nr:ribonuclease HII [Alicyclobacillus tolerans]MCF8564734.1 ribonuclease HII [Alicyclobacillus tolerans]
MSKKAQTVYARQDLSEKRCKELWDYEQSLVSLSGQASGCFAGVDEAGRGALAGPVFAAAVVLGGGALDWMGVNDSKQVTKKRREELYHVIRKRAVAVGVGTASVAEIDRDNILHASRKAMGRALQELHVELGFALVDGTYTPVFDSHDFDRVLCTTVIDGDAKCMSIAAASIVAKVERDRFMAQLGEDYPEYGFEQHAGYGTAFHREALQRHGPSPWHRTSFAPVKLSLQMELGF